MMFVAIYQQHGEGCDYSIGCGIKYKIFEADNRQSAIEKLYKEIVVGTTYGNGDEAETCWPYSEETELSYLVLAELPEYLPIDKWNGEIAAQIQKQKDKFNRLDEIKEFERLKAKYEK